MLKKELQSKESLEMFINGCKKAEGIIKDIGLGRAICEVNNSFISFDKGKIMQVGRLDHKFSIDLNDRLEQQFISKEAGYSEPIFMIHEGMHIETEMSEIIFGKEGVDINLEKCNKKIQELKSIIAIKDKKLAEKIK